jgi:hypothetical protein
VTFRPTVEFNHDLARRLEEAAALLESQGANPFRARAYRRAADAIATHPQDLRELVAERGADALEDLPHVGPGIASALRELLETGRWSQLDRLRGEAGPEALLATVPGVGRELARTIHERLHVETLEALEVAAWDGSLAAVPGIGPRRLAGIRDGLALRLGRLRRAAAAGAALRPGIDALLDVDRAYRAGAADGSLPRIAPRRFNPTGEAWLPILHATRGRWHFTALYSNTALAHELGRTHDWVVVYWHDGRHEERQCTIVTETVGPLAGRRVVRGREAECADRYGAELPAAPRRRSRRKAAANATPATLEGAHRDARSRAPARDDRP